MSEGLTMEEMVYLVKDARWGKVFKGRCQPAPPANTTVYVWMEDDVVRKLQTRDLNGWVGVGCEFFCLTKADADHGEIEVRRGLSYPWMTGPIPGNEQ